VLSRDVPLATGAWSTVRLGHLTSNATVLLAIKLPLPATSTSARGVLAAEAALLTRLHAVPGAAGAGIVPFRGLDRARGALALGLLEGGSLQDLIDGPLARLPSSAERDAAVAEVVPWLARRLVGALAWLHEEARVVHGDVKPGNVLLGAAAGGGGGGGAEGWGARRAVLADFTSSHAIGAAPPALSAGTFAYLAPEMAGGGGGGKRAAGSAPAGDVWALGATLLAVAMGAAPYHGPRGSRAPQRRVLIAMVHEGGVVQRARDEGLITDGKGAARALKAVKPALRTCVTERASAVHWGVVINEETFFKD
jgi:serine/threonine protein kinase